MEALATPWKIWNEARRLSIYPLARLLFVTKGVKWGTAWRLHGLPVIHRHRESRMSLGNGLGLRSTRCANPLGANHPVILCTWRSGALLKVGDDFGMTGGSIVVANRITIGDRVTVGANCTIIDTDFHPLDSELRRRRPQDAKTAPIIIEDDVFMGMNCIVLKGVTIGHGAVIGAGSVVTRDVPSRMIAAGNPARIIGEVGS